jgi:hypothetical protein
VGAGARPGGRRSRLKVLLLHSEDTFPLPGPREHWDLIVDFARAPAITYENWGRQADCQIFSLFQFAEEIEDLCRVRQLLQLGKGCLADAWGIDWWDVLSLEIVPQLQQFMLLHRLAKKLSPSCELYSSRPDPRATALSRVLGARLTILETRVQSVIHRARHYREVFAHLDTNQLTQALEDKFDGDHSIRRHFTRRGHTSRQPVILAPSAYINVSRTVLSYAERAPDHEFLLVRTRSNAMPPSLPANVCSKTLAPYFIPSNRREIASLLEVWNALRKRLVCGAEEFDSADAVGILRRVAELLPWGIALRDAWYQLFESENVSACLSADDSNPPSRIPLIIARNRGIPALACHHGALDYMMAIKENHADRYLVKSQMERDYVRRVCQLAPEEIAVVEPVQPRPLALPAASSRSTAWLVFFTEPYQAGGWRSDEVYRDLVPRLCSLAQTCGLRLVFKLHPFESVKGHRRMLTRIAPAQEGEIEVLAGPPSDQLWSNTRIALTVQSSTGLECAALNIPVFFCAWLRDAYSGYVQQYERFGIGHVLESSDEIGQIPKLLDRQSRKSVPPRRDPSQLSSDELSHLFSGTYSFPVASSA